MLHAGAPRSIRPSALSNCHLNIRLTWFQLMEVTRQSERELNMEGTSMLEEISASPRNDVISLSTKRSATQSSTTSLRDEATSTKAHTRRTSNLSVASDYSIPDSPGSSSRPQQAQGQKEADTEAELLGELESIQVLVRVRPLLPNEEARGGEAVVECCGEHVSVKAGARRSIRCKYDHAFGPSARQTDVYKQVEDCSARVLQGYNATIMAYGQTGSGKTHTMFGPQGYTLELAKAGRLPEVVGIIPRAIRDVFTAVRGRPPGDGQVTVFCSFVQIYNEQLYDMLRDGGRDNPLVIHEDGNREIFVHGLSEFMVKSGDECMALLRIGEEHRAIRETHMNMASSRSHSIFTLVLEQHKQDPQTGEVRHLRSKLNLVDLAGSEKWDTSVDMGTQHALELSSINYSLFTLGRCIAALTAKNGAAHVPYRDSKLTRLIQDSLGGNTRTRIIATLSPTIDCVDETVSTLKFADRAKQVLVYVRESEKHAVDHVLLERLQREVARLRTLVLKLRENQCEGPAGLIALYQDGRKLTVKDVVERNALLTEQLAKERAERERLEACSEELKSQLLSDRRGPPSLPDTARTRSGDQDATPKSGRQAQAPLGSGRADTKGHHTGRHEHEEKDHDKVPLSQYEEVAGQLQEAQGVKDMMCDLLAKFFSFEMEEAELRKRLEPYVANVDALIRTPRPQKKPMMQGHSPSPQGKGKKGQEWDEHGQLPSVQGTGRGVGNNAGGKRQWAQRSAHTYRTEPHDDGEEEDGEGEEEEEEEAGEGGAEDPLRLVLPRLNAEGVPRVAYRIRGREGEGDDRRFRSLAYGKEDEEQKLILQLKEARRRMRKHMKLQEWLLQKEQKELEAAEREEDERRSQERAQKERDARFRERALRQKLKLEKYYAGLKKAAALDTAALREAGEGSPVRHGSNGSNSTDVSPARDSEIHMKKQAPAPRASGSKIIYLEESPPRGYDAGPRSSREETPAIQPPATLPQELDLSKM